MAQNLAQKKTDALTALTNYAAKAEAMAEAVADLVSYFTDNGFLTGGANAIVDADCVSPNDHLTAALVNSGITSIGTVTLSNANKTVLRQISKLPINPGT